jgi:2-methylcitrate dehydratase PrpD
VTARSPSAPAGPTAELAAFASGLEAAKLPPAVVEHAKLCILDALGCGAFGATLAWGRILDEFAVAMGGRPEATIWGSGVRVPAANAALVNGTLVHSFELDDLHKESILHPTAAALPAALSVAEMEPGISGPEFLTAVVAGFEVGIRVGVAVGTAQLLRGFHPTGTLGGVAAAAAAGRALRLSPREMAHALGIATTQGAGLMAAQYESMVKRMHAGRAAQSGVYGALLARRGFTGIERVFEEPYGGFCSTIGDGADLGALTRGLGQEFETLRIGFKGYACCGSCHAAVEAMLRLKREHGLAPADVRRIEVWTTEATLLHVGWPYEPGGVTRAQMNLPYCAAVALADGEAFVDQFTEARVRDPELAALARRVEVRSDPALDALGPGGRHAVRVRLTLADGRALERSQRHAKGSAADPLSREEVVGKFHRLAGQALGESNAGRVLESVMRTEEHFSAADWGRMMMRIPLDVGGFAADAARHG